MSETKQLERTASNLSPVDLAQLRAWFFECDTRVWDTRIESDLKAGKLDTFVSEARTD